jgi:aspartate racemase
VRTLGLLGGMSWESSIVYERIINETVRARLGRMHSADLLIRSYDFARIAALQADGRWDEAASLLASDALTLERAGAAGIVLCTNTMHRVADAIDAALCVPLLHIADPVVQAAREAGVHTVALLGTRFTMEEPFLVDRLRAGGLAVSVPSPDDRGLIHRVIYDELVRGEVRESSRASYVRVVERMVRDGAQALVAGCTEIELLLRQDDVPVPMFATTRLHAEAAAAFALA